MTMKTKISTKIKLIGAFLVALMLGIITSNLYLNDKNKKDALIINIAGKERMLTQKISKEIFYLYNNKQSDFSSLDNAVEEFIYNIQSLQNGNKLMGISKVPTAQIAQQLAHVQILWNSFNKNIQSFKNLQINHNSNNHKLLKSKVNAIFQTNNELLEEVDKIVSLYTQYAEKKTQYLQNFQYIAVSILLLIILYSLYQLKEIEAHAKEFLDYSKKVINFQHEDKHLELINIEAESEIVEATDNLNCFITKINSVMDYSSEAIAKSQKASEKLEEITDEFDQIIHDMKGSSIISTQLDKTEDMMIQSHEDLIKSTKKLENLKKELDKVLNSCS